MFHQSATVLRAPVVRDKYRNEIRDWTQATRRSVLGLNVQPAGRAETHQPGQRDAAVSGWVLQTAPGVDLDLLATDRVELPGGVVCEVVGEVSRWTDPLTGGVHHVEARLERVTG